MKNQKKISLIIPTLNEAENISHLLRNIPGYIDEIIIVDGYSKDETARIAKMHGCKVVYDKKGKGSSLIKGAKEASGDYLVMMDADLSHRIKEIKLLITGLDIGYDITMGSRFMQGGGSSDITFLRKIGNKFFVALVNFFFNMHYTDLCYGYRAFRKDAFDRLKLKSKGFSIETEISIKAAKKRLKVIEIPSFEKSRKHGKAKLRTFSDGWKILKIILREILE